MLPYRHDDTLSQFLKSLRKKRYWFVIVRVVEVLYGWELEGQQRASPYYSLFISFADFSEWPD